MLDPKPTEADFARLFQQAVGDEVKRTLDVEIEKAKANIEQAIRGSVGAITAKIMSNFSFARLGTDLHVTVHFAFPEPKKDPTRFGAP